MSASPGRIVLLVVAWALTVLIVAWSHLPARLRRGIALATSAAGLLFLMLALGAEGQRETAGSGSFLLGTRYAVQTVSASAGLPYYVLTAVCLLLGTAGLALPESVVQRLRDHWLAIAVVFGLAVTVVRFALEKAAAPTMWTWAVGVTALPPAVGAVFAWRLRSARRALAHLTRALLIYGVAVRAGVAAMYALATGLHLGSHYDLSRAQIALSDPFTGRVSALAPGSLAQLAGVVLVPQLLIWPLYTVAVGLAAGLPVLLLGRSRSGLPTAEAAA